jgi:hypothetical protein
MYPEELTAGLGMRSKVFGRDVESPGSKRLVDRNVDASKPSPIHAYMGHQISALVGNRYVHRLANLHRLLFSGRYYPSGISQSDHSANLRRNFNKKLSIQNSG